MRHHRIGKLPAIAVAALCAASLSASAAEPVAPGEVVWVDDYTIPAALTDTSGDVANGAALMNKGAGNCIACHEVSALSHLAFQGNVGPALDGVADRRDAAELRGIVVNVKKMSPDTIMPAFYRVDGFNRPGDAFTGKAAQMPLAPLLTAQEVEDLVAFLLTLKD